MPTLPLAFLLGLLLGGLALTRETALVLIPLVLAWVVAPPARQAVRCGGGGRVIGGAALLLGLCAVLGPVAVRNAVVGGEFALTTAQFGPNFYMGNHAGATGLYTPFRPAREHPDFERTDAIEVAEEATGRAMTVTEASAYWRNQALDYIRREPLDWLKLMGGKLLLTWNAVEIADAEDIASYAAYSPVLSLPMRVLHFGVLVPLAALGVALTWRRRRELWILYLMALALSLATAAFYVFARYRFVLAPILIPFAAAACAEIHSALRGRTRSRTPPSSPTRIRIVGAAALIVVSALIGNWPVLTGYDPRIATWNNLGLALAARGDLDGAADWYQRVLQAEPAMAGAHSNLASVLLLRQDYAGVIEHARRAIKLSPDLASAYQKLAAALLKLDQLADAERAARTAVRLLPASADARCQLAAVLTRSGRLDEASALYQHVLDRDPQSIPALMGLAQVFTAQTRPREAIAALRKVTSLVPDMVLAHRQLGEVLERTGSHEEAIASYRRALQLAQAAQLDGLPDLLEARLDHLSAISRSSTRPTERPHPPPP